MFVKSFIISKERFNRGKYRIFQHKLRVAFKCYTLMNLKIDPSAQTFECKKKFRINMTPICMGDITHGKYTAEEVNDGKDVLLSIYVD